jgi:hypothetical protein
MNDFASLRASAGLGTGVSSRPSSPLRLCILALVTTGAGCVPPGNATPSDAGAPSSPTAARTAPTVAPTAAASPDVMKAPFEDNFDHPDRPSGLAVGGPEAGPVPAPDGSELEPSADWVATSPGIWHIENGRLCGQNARNHGIWLKKTLPVNARIEFDAVSQSADGDLKAEYWGDGRSFATALSYTNATSYLTIFGGWHNTFHVLARINEHATDRKEIKIDKDSDDPREKPVMAAQLYHFKVERTDGKTVHWSIDGNEMLSYPDPLPLTGIGHDHFGFNDWEVKVCFDNVRVAPLP